MGGKNPWKSVKVSKAEWSPETQREKPVKSEAEKPVKTVEKGSNEAEKGISTKDLADLKAKIKAVVELKAQLEAEREASTQHLADVKAKIKAGDELKAQLEAELNAKEK